MQLKLKEIEAKTVERPAVAEKKMHLLMLATRSS